MEPYEIKPIKTESKEQSFHFKKEKIKDAQGNTIGEGKKLPSVNKALPVPSVEGILEIVQAGGKELQLLMDAVTEVVYSAARTVVNDLREKLPDGQEIKPDMIDDSKLSWSYIANTASTERRGLGLTDDDWEGFSADYRAIMPKATGKDVDRIEKHIQLFRKKFYPCRNDKKALGVLSDMLSLWAVSTSTMEDNKDVYEYLKGRVETLLAEEEKVLAEAL